MPAQVLSVAALESSHDGPLAAEPRLVSLRSQVAVVRALADQVEQFSRAANVDGLAAQIVEEMARLGRRLLDAAAALARASAVEDSGVFTTMGDVKLVTARSRSGTTLDPGISAISNTENVAPLKRFGGRGPLSSESTRRGLR
jgi:hypothetical protein